MVWGFSLVWIALSSNWWFRTGWSLLFTMKACGHTKFMISWRTNSDAADVLTLNPVRVSSNAMVAVPPVDEDDFCAAPLGLELGATASIARLKAETAAAAHTVRLILPLSSIAVLTCRL
jgi:hypothetical protein